MHFTGFRLFMLLTVAAVMTAALSTDPESVVPEMEDIQSAQVTPSTPGHYTITHDGSYEVKNNNYANDTPAPYPDTMPAPGSMGMARGIDRNDLSRSKLPIFHWTWTKFMDSVNDMNGDAPSGGGHEFEVWVDGEIRMVPDQMYMSGPSSRCESASSAKVKVVSSSSEMNQYEASSFSAGYDQEIDVGVSAEIPGTGVGVEASTTLQTKMMTGSSESSQEYKAEADLGSDMSAFATITSWNYDVFVKNTTSMSSDFTAEIAKLNVDSSDPSMRKFFSLFGTDYLYAAKLGGKVTQQTSAKEKASSSTQKADLAESSSASFGFNFMKLDTSSSSAQSDSVTKGKSKGFTTHKARFEGGEPSEDWMEWCQSTAKKPSLVSFETRSVSSLVAQTDRALAAKLEEFLVGRLERIEACEGHNSGMQYDTHSGKCIVGECASGSYQKDSNDSKDLCYVRANSCQNTAGQSVLTEAECSAYVTAESKTAHSPFSDSWETDCLGCVEAEDGTVGFNTDTDAQCTSLWLSVCKKECAAGRETMCHECEAGKFQPQGEEHCEDCPAGKYADETRTAVNCKSCQVGKTSDTGSASCDYLSGDYWITTGDDDSHCSLRPADSSDRGDDGLPDDSGKWAVIDCNNGYNLINIKYLPDDPYYNQYELKSGAHYLGDSYAAGKRGSSYTCGDGTWGYFGTSRKQVTLEPGSYGAFKIQSNYNVNALGWCGGGSEDKEAGTAWAFFGATDTYTYLIFTLANTQTA